MGSRLRVRCVSLLAACGSAPLAPLHRTAELAKAPSVPRPAPVFQGLQKPQEDALVALDADTRTVVESAAFRAAVEDIDAIDAAANGDPFSGGAVARIYAGEVARFVRAPICYGYDADESSSETANTKVKQQACGVDDAALLVVHQTVLNRANGGIDGRACAINTLAHEWTHAIYDPHRPMAKDPWMIFVDGDPDSAPSAVVSYTIGAIAQCVYLRTTYQQLDLATCIDAVGTRTFRPCTCQKGWAEHLDKGVDVCAGAR